MHIYLIIYNGFDRLENRNPWYKNPIGYIEAENEETVKQWVKKKTKETLQYKGWDGQMYPYFTYQRIEKLQ